MASTIANRLRPSHEQIAKHVYELAEYDMSRVENQLPAWQQIEG
ncbi:MAG: hypothetical protein ABW171_15355 [Steroidobacter sp.]